MSGERLYGRSVRLVLGSLLIEGLRVQLKVKKTLRKEPNECLVTVFNLNEQHRAALQTKGLRMLVEAGYSTTIGQIFSGDIRYATSTHEGPDWLTKVQSADGERAYRWNQVAESFSAGTSVGDVFSKIAKATGLDVTDAVSTVKSIVTEQFTQGFVAFGKSSTEVDRLLTGRGLEWSVQDGKMQVLQEGGTLKDSAILLNKSSGLIGSPEFGTHAEKGKKKATILKVKTLLMPGLKPGAKIRVESVYINGDFKVVTVEHTGDSHGPEWYSTCEATPIS